MKKRLAVLIVALLSTQAYAEQLTVTFGAASDLAAQYGEHNLTGNAKQSADIVAPKISIGGLDLDGIGANDDRIELEFAVTATGGEVARFAQGYRLDAGYTLKFEIVSAKMVLAAGKATALEGNFVSASGNNRGASFTTENKGQSLVLTSSASANNRARRIVAKFDVLVDASQLAPPIITKPADLGHQYPQHQFNAMIYPVRPYGIRGIIWYQG